jgi:hypothetical protein
MSKFDFGNNSFDQIDYIKKNECDETFVQKVLMGKFNRKIDISQEIEKVLAFMCNNTANIARSSYPGIDI